jgi:hypothetical protein
MQKKGKLCFLDDAGDPGFKLNHGSSQYFVIACVAFDDRLVAEEVALEMKKLRRELGWNEHQEFKFNKTRKDVIRDLIGRVSGFDYNVYAMCADKALVRKDNLRKSSENFYNYMVYQTLNQIPNLSLADVRLDGQPGRNYKQSAITYFRRELNATERKLAQFRFVDSKGNLLIQLADIVAGSILRSKQATTDSQVYYNLIKPRVANLRDFK